MARCQWFLFLVSSYFISFTLAAVHWSENVSEFVCSLTWTYNFNTLERKYIERSCKLDFSKKSHIWIKQRRTIQWHLFSLLVDIFFFVRVGGGLQRHCSGCVMLYLHSLLWGKPFSSCQKLSWLCAFCYNNVMICQLKHIKLQYAVLTALTANFVINFNDNWWIYWA